MRRVECRFKEKGIVAAIGVDGDMDIGDVRVLEVSDEVGLFFGIEAIIFVDTEDQVMVAVFL